MRQWIAVVASVDVGKIQLMGPYSDQQEAQRDATMPGVVNVLLIDYMPMPDGYADLVAALQAVRNYGSRGELDDGTSVSYLVETALAKAGVQ